MARFYVHRYDVVRIKVAVEAETQEEAMIEANKAIYAQPPITHEILIDSDYHFEGIAPCVVEYEDAEEVRGYLVDEVGDEEFARTRRYDCEMKPE